MTPEIIPLKKTALTLLENWADAVEQYWFDVDTDAGIGCYGPGYIHWGVQSNFNYISAMATLALHGKKKKRDHRLARARAALRFNMASHNTGDRTGLAGKKWGNSWISMLGIERGMHGINLITDLLPQEDRDHLRKMLVSEADWVLHDAQRGNQKGVFGGIWGDQGSNAPESNVWWATLLWRISRMYAEEKNASLWAERSHDYFINGVSIPADEHDETVVAGKAVKDRFKGANFFPNFALDHHGYLNVGYAYICMSNAAMLHFDLKIAGHDRPGSLDHHQEDLWNVIRHFVFNDGRLARIGGDSRIRYAYCQEYLLPSLMYAADRFNAPEAYPLIVNQIGLIQKEASSNAERGTLELGTANRGKGKAVSLKGLLYGSRLETMRRNNPHYYTRLESDRACVLSQFLNFSPQVNWPKSPKLNEEPWAWEEPEHGAVCVRTEKRFASFSWRPYSVTQALCLPPDKGDMAEWYMNLTPEIRFIGDAARDRRGSRKIQQRNTELFNNGFVTCGSVMEGVGVTIDEGGHLTDQAVTHIAFTALPDGQTCLGLQYCVASDDRSVFTDAVKTLHLNIPNDVYNGFKRNLITAEGKIKLKSPVKNDSVIDTGGKWVNIDNVLGVVGVYGGTLKIDRYSTPRGGRYENIRVEEICMDIQHGAVRRGYGEVIADCGFAILCEVDAEKTSEFKAGKMKFSHDHVRGIKVKGLDGRKYAFIANFGDKGVKITAMKQEIVLGAGVAVVLS